MTMLHINPKGNLPLRKNSQLQSVQPNTSADNPCIKMESHNAKSSLFHTHKSDTTVKSMEWIEYRPVGQLNSEGALEFNVSGNSTKYVDLQNTKLKVKFRILQENGSVLPAAVAGDKPTPDAAKVGPTNLFLQTMWRQVDVTVQQQVVSANTATKYPYKAYIETLLNYGEDAKRT